MAGLEFRVLGTVEVRGADGDVVPLPSRRVAVLLAALVLRVNRTIRIEELVELLWSEEELPSNPRAALQIYISRLRTTLGDTDRSMIRTGAGGYSLRVDPAQVDVEVFRSLVRTALETADPAARIEPLAAALALWRGEPLAGLDTGAVARDLIPRLDEEHLQARELYFDARLAAGEAADLVPELTELAERHPTRERFAAQLIRAHQASGRTALALATYGDVAERLRDLLGADPGPELRALYADLLTATDSATDPATDSATDSATGGTEASAVVPRQLPASIPAFTGRTEHLQRLDELMPTAGLALIIGPAGVGKTSLAVHWARRVENRFPDGILYADLLGFSPAAEPADPHAILSRFLVALGTPSDRLPATPDGQIALYRSLLADRALLVVLDNARTADQVRPLAAAGSRCCTVVTSRNELAGLVAAEQAEPIRLDVFDPAQSKQLLAARIGGARFGSDPAGVDALVERCAGLPLALSLLAAQIALRPHRSLASFVDALGDGPLDALSTADGVGVRTIFSWSYRQLRPELARMFRLLAQHPGSEITLGAAAALAGVPVREAVRLLAELVANHQLIEIGPDRWVLHDLIRAYGQELCEPGEADAAFERLLGYLVHTGYAAAILLAPTRVRVGLPDPPADVEVVAPATREEAFAWFDAEQPNNLAVLRAAAGRADVLLWLYVWAIADYLDFRGRSGYQQAQQLALEAAVRLGDLTKQAHTRRDLARGHIVMREWDEAIRQHELALGIAEEQGDEAGIAHGSLGLGRVYTRIGNQREAIRHTLRALRIYERSGHVEARANALNNLGWYHSELGEYETGLDYAQQSLKLYAEVDSEFGRAVAGDTAGYALAGMGRFDEAIALYTVAVDVLRRLGRRLDTADCLMAMARVQDRAGRGEGAKASYAAALEILDALGHPDAATVRNCLAKQR